MSEYDYKPQCFTCNGTRQITKLFERACSTCGGTGRITTHNYPESYTGTCGSCDNGKIQSWGPARCDAC
jgi:DnaJ-class molecular chaperone